MLNKTSESKTSLSKELTNFSYSSSYKDSHKNSIIDIKQKYSGTNINRSNDYNRNILCPLDKNLKNSTSYHKITMKCDVCKENFTIFSRETTNSNYKVRNNLCGKCLKVKDKISESPKQIRKEYRLKDQITIDNEKQFLEKNMVKNRSLEEIRRFREEILKVNNDYPLEKLDDFLKNNKLDILKDLDNNNIYSSDFLRYLEKNIESLMKEFMNKISNNNQPHKLLNKKRLIFKTNKIEKNEKINQLQGKKIPQSSELFKASSLKRDFPNNRIIQMNPQITKNHSTKSDSKHIIINLECNEDNDENKEKNIGKKSNQVINTQCTIDEMNKRKHSFNNTIPNCAAPNSKKQSNICSIDIKDFSSSHNNYYLETVYTSFSGKIPRNYIGKILKIWDFALNILKMDYFSEEDFYEILVNQNESFTLISLLHRKLIKFLINLLINEIEYENIDNNYLLILKMICQENDPEDLIKLSWFEILKILLIYPQFNVLFKNQKDIYLSLKKISYSSYNKLSLDIKIILLHSLIDTCLSYNIFKKSLEEERNYIKHIKDLYYLNKTKYDDNKLKLNVMNDSLNNPDEIISVNNSEEIKPCIRKIEGENIKLKRIYKQLEIEIYMFSLKNTQFLGRDRYGNRFYFFLYASDKIYIKSFKAGRGWFYISTNDQLIRILQSLSIGNFFENILIKNILLVFGKLTNLDGNINEEKVSKLHKAYIIHISSDVEVCLEEKEQSYEFYRNSETFPLIHLREKTAQSICEVISTVRNNSKCKKNNSSQLRNSFINVSNCLKIMENKFSECLKSNGKQWESQKYRQEIVRLNLKKHEKLDNCKQTKNFNNLKEICIIFTERFKFCYDINEKIYNNSSPQIVKLWKKEFIDKELNKFFTNFVVNEVFSIESLYLGVKFFELVVLTYVKNHTKIIEIIDKTPSPILLEEESSFSQKEKTVKKKNCIDSDDEEYKLEKEENEDIEENIYKTSIKNKLQKKFRNRLRKINKIDNLGKKRLDLKFEALQNICEMCGDSDDLINCWECLSYFHLECIDLKTLPEKWKCGRCRSKKVFLIQKMGKERDLKDVKIAKKHIFTIMKNR